VARFKEWIYVIVVVSRKISTIAGINLEAKGIFL